MGAPEMYPDAYRDHLTGDPAYDKAFAALADCPTFGAVEKALKMYAHELAEAIRNSESLRNHTDDHMGDCNAAADLIDPEAS